MIDWNGVILALIALISTIIVTLAPIAITAFINMHTAKLTEFKALTEKYDLIAERTVLLIQATYGALANSAKFQLAMQSIKRELGDLTFDALRDLLNTAVGTMHLVWGDAWQELKEPPETPIPNQPIPQETPPPA